MLVFIIKFVYFVPVFSIKESISCNNNINDSVIYQIFILSLIID